MKRLISLATLVLALAALVAVTGCSGSGSSTGVKTGAVIIKNYQYGPAAITIKAGDTVTWTNNDDTLHTVTTKEFDSGGIAVGATYSHTFDKAGTYDYHCRYHPAMVGKITAQ
jgi:plastocyanin